MRAWEEVDRDDEATAMMERAAVEQPEALCRFSQKARVKPRFRHAFETEVFMAAEDWGIDIAVQRDHDGSGLFLITGSGPVVQVKSFFDDLDQLPLRSRSR
jgi:hypothetical protein